MGVGGAERAHLVHHGGHAANCELPCCLAARQAAADDVNRANHRAIWGGVALGVKGAGMRANNALRRHRRGARAASRLPSGGDPGDVDAVRVQAGGFLMGVRRVIALAALAGAAVCAQAQAAEVKVLTAGTLKGVVVALAPQFERQSAEKLVVENDTVGALSRRIENGEACDVVIATPAALRSLAGKGKVAEESARPVARVGIGVMVKVGAPKPDVSTVEAFKDALRNAKTVAYIDPASGGSSGVYLTQLFERLGIAADINGKARLKQGGHVADLIVSNEAELGIHQISEILPVAGVTLVGPLPEAIQNYTAYSAAACAASKDSAAVRRFIDLLAGPEAKPVLNEKGLVPAG